MQYRHIIFASLLAMPVSVLGNEAPTAKPNIIFLLADDLAASAVGYSGNKEVVTPHIDKLAQEGVRFMNHYNTTSICMASRCSIMTGIYEYRHGCNFEHGDLDRRFIEKSYPMILREKGYFTGFAGKIGFVLQGEKFEALEPLFDQWAGGPEQTHYETAKNIGIAKYAEQYPHCSRAYGAWGQDFLKAAKQSGKPFCMSISFKAPHGPFKPDPIDLKLYEGKTFTLPSNYGAENRKHLSPQAQKSRAAAVFHKEWGPGYDSTVAHYYGLVTGIDAAVGMIRETLKHEGLDNNTVIIFTSDNGFNAGSHGFGDKVLPYEEACKAPLIIYDPRLPAERNNQTSEAITGNVDIAPTVLALAGETASADINGKSLLPLLTNPTGKIHDYLPLFNFFGTEAAQSMAIVTPEWKFIHWYYGDGMNPTDELFDLAGDSYEMKNVASDTKHSGVIAMMRSHYDAELAALNAELIRGKAYEEYPTLFSRTIPWEEKTQAIATKRANRKALAPDKEARKKPER
jgi:arylsulfatase A-like enzyme